MDLRQKGYQARPEQEKTLADKACQEITWNWLELGIQDSNLD